MNIRLTPSTDWKPLVLYALLALAIIGPWLTRGYILTLDMVFTPTLRMPESATSSYAFHSTLHILNFVLPADIIQKLLLFGIFFASGFGMYRLMKQLASNVSFGAYCSGLLYTINPFTYDRLMAGQYAILLGYALLPFLCVAVIRFLESIHTQQAMRVLLWLLLISIVSIHTLVPALIALLTISILRGVSNKQLRQKWRQLALYTIAVAAGFVVLSSYWLVPLATDSSTTSNLIQRFDSGDYAAFATEGNSTAERLMHVFALQGFWAEGQALFTLPQSQVGEVWGVLLLILWALVITGGVYGWRQHRRLAVLFCGFCIIIGAILASGLASEVVSRLWLLRGYREPQKFAMLIALGYSILGGLGASVLIRISRQEFGQIGQRTVALLVVTLVIALTPVMLWGANGQLSARQYPASWHDLNEHLTKDAQHSKTLFLPWHLYMNFGFAERIIAHPAPHFFDVPVIVSDDPEYAGASRTSTNSDVQAIHTTLSDKPAVSDFANVLATHDVQYIVLLNEYDADKYDFLEATPSITKVTQTAEYTLFRNDAHAALTTKTGGNHAAR